MARMRRMLPAASLVAGMVLTGLLGGCTEPRLPDAGRFVARGAGGRVISTDCFGPGQPDARGSWPDDDAKRFRFMPPGCSTATAIAQMVVDPNDLVRGRPLPPGAALPVARAIERYYNREADSPTPVAATVPGMAPGTAPGTQVPAAAPVPGPGATDAPAQGVAGAGDGAAGLLQGPLTTPATAATAPAPAQ